MASTASVETRWQARVNAVAVTAGQARPTRLRVLAVSFATWATACGAAASEELSRGSEPGITIRIVETTHVDVSRIIGAAVESTGRTILAWGGVRDPVFRWHVASGRIDTIHQPKGWRGAAGYLLTRRGEVYLVDSIGTTWAPGSAVPWLPDDRSPTVAGTEVAVIGGTTEDRILVTRTGVAVREWRDGKDSVELNWFDPNVTPVVESGEKGRIWERRSLRSLRWQADGTRHHEGPLPALETDQPANPRPQWAAISVVRLFGQHVVSLVDRTSSERRILRLDETGRLLGCAKPGGRFVLLGGDSGGNRGVAASATRGGALHLVVFDSAVGFRARVDSNVSSCFT